MEKNYTTIATFTYESEMLVLLGKLESEGIRCFTQKRTFLSVHPMLSAALGGITLMVHKDDVEIAQEILKGFDLDQSGKVKLDIIYKGIRYSKTSGFCPDCDENTIYKERLPIIELIKGAVLFKKAKHYCNACKHTWVK